MRQLAQLRSVLPQQTKVGFPFQGEQVVRMGRAPWAGLRDADDDALVAAAMERADVVHLAGRPYPRLSGGERARVSLTRVLAQDAQLVLLDEPTASLDVVTRSW